MTFVAVAVVAIGGRSRGLVALKRAGAWAAHAVSSLLEYSRTHGGFQWDRDHLLDVRWERLVPRWYGPHGFDGVMENSGVCPFRCRRRCLPTLVASRRSCRATSSDTAVRAFDKNIVEIACWPQRNSKSRSMRPSWPIKIRVMAPRGGGTGSLQTPPHLSISVVRSGVLTPSVQGGVSGTGGHGGEGRVGRPSGHLLGGISRILGRREAADPYTRLVA